jgi:hypothetical protein
MADSREILEKIKGFPPKERAAAIAHWVYVTTADKDENWNARVPREWSDLSPEARIFNLASVETWAHAEGVAQAWFDALKAFQEAGRLGGDPSV